MGVLQDEVTLDFLPNLGWFMRQFDITFNPPVIQPGGVNWHWGCSGLDVPGEIGSMLISAPGDNNVELFTGGAYDFTFPGIGDLMFQLYAE
jgi:hypothetical protein